MRNQLQFLIVLWVVLLSGAVVFGHYYYEMLAIFALLIITYLFKFKIKTRIFKKSSTFLVSVFLLLFLSLIYNSDMSNTFTYLHLFSRFFIASTIPLVLCFSEFRDKYLNIIFILCLSSLLIFPFVVFFRDIVNYFPVITSETGALFHNLFLSVYNAPLPNFPKNGSVFWEPGAFQAFINIALAFEFITYKFQNKKRIFIFIITLITTFSTTAYIILAIQLTLVIVFKKSTDKKIFTKITKLFSIILIGLFLFSSLFISTVLDKFSETNQSFFIRSAGTLVDLDIFQNSIYFGVGPSEYLSLVETIAFNEYGLNMGVSSNSLTKFMAIYGILILILILYYYFKATSILIGKNLINRIIFFGIFIIIFVTENFITSFFFLAILFYGLQNKLINNN